MEAVMMQSIGAAALYVAIGIVLAVLAMAVPFGVRPARAQQPAALEAGLVVTGDGSVSVPPDHARISSGVTTRAKTAREATDANTKQMTAIMAALRDAGIAANDIKTSRFSIQPVYPPPQPGVEQKVSGYSVSNQLDVTIRQIDKVGDVLDRLVSAGVTDVGNIAFLVGDTSKLLDQARTAAVADARRKADIYASAAGIKLGAVAFITEDSGFVPPIAGVAPRALAARAVPISTGEDTLRVSITVGFQIAR
jgi:uncharacterized protein